jgi:pilus assembly protein CpaF
VEPSAPRPEQATGAQPKPVAPAQPPRIAQAKPELPAQIDSRTPAQPQAKPERKPTERQRSEEYYDVKTTVFNALIDTIDLTQLAKLDPEAAREEIRDIVGEIVAIKNVVMSIAEQEELLEDICNDVLGYGPLEPLLARDDIADIMVNGADTTYIEVEGKVEPSAIRFADNAQLMNICQRIVSQVGRRVDEASPICGTRACRTAAASRHRPAARHRRSDPYHPQI